ncbi:MAG: nucleotidyltransferase family protein [Armatimonadota bacterium]|nr:nucleotidyltransferase family protein [bacterium]
MSTPVNKTNAIIVAAPATENTDLPIQPAHGTKSLISVNGRPALYYVVENLRKSDRISKIILVSDEIVREAAPNVDVYVDAAGDESASVIAGIREAADASRCMVMTGDLPLASTEAIDDLLTYAPTAGVIYPIVEKSDVKASFPDREAYYIGTREGKFTGSSCLLFDPQVALSRESFVISLLNARRDPTLLLGLVGPGLALKVMFSNVSVKELEETLSRVINAECRVFLSHYPELFISIDSARDLAIIEQSLNTYII